MTSVNEHMVGTFSWEKEIQLIDRLGAQAKLIQAALFSHTLLYRFKIPLIKNVFAISWTMTAEATGAVDTQHALDL